MLEKLLRSQAILIIVLGVLAPSKSNALGDPLVNLGVFFEHIFRVQFDSPESISNAYSYEPREDTQIDRRDFALRRSNTKLSHRKSLECTDFELRNHDDWKQEQRIAVEITQEWKNSDKKNDWPPKGAYTTPYYIWNSPAFAHVFKRRTTLFGNLRKARISIAVLGENFDISLVWDERTSDLTTNTIRLIKAVHRFGYEGLYDVQISGKEIDVTRRISCRDGFSIFDFEIKK